MFHGGGDLHPWSERGEAEECVLACHLLTQRTPLKELKPYKPGVVITFASLITDRFLETPSSVTHSDLPRFSPC